MYVVEAALTFFGMETVNDQPTKHFPSSVWLISNEAKEVHFDKVLNKFLNEFVFDEHEVQPGSYDTTTCSEPADKITAYAINLLRHFILLEDLRDAVREGNGARLANICKTLLVHFKTLKSFNSYAIEMLVSIVQNNALLSEGMANQCIWAATTNWKGGSGKNIEIDLLQENQNCDQKNLIRAMGANQTEKAITRASKASGGIREIVDNFDEIAQVKQKSGMHTHACSTNDEMTILEDLRDLRPFIPIPGRAHPSFKTISHDPTYELDTKQFQSWCERHIKKIVQNGYRGQIVENEDPESSSDEN